MRKSTTTSPMRGVLKRTVATVGVMGTLAVGWVYSPIEIHSREVEAFKEVNAQAAGAFQIGTMVDVEAQFTAPPGTQPHDEFSLHLPEHLVMKSKSFTITEGQASGKGGATIADCETTTARIRCVFSEYLATHNNVAGMINFQARVVSEPVSSTVMWRDGLGSMFVTQFDETGSASDHDIETVGETPTGTAEDFGIDSAGR